MEVISIASLAAFLSPFFVKAGETLSTETVKLALEKRQDIKDGFVNLFKPEEIITLGLNEDRKPEEVLELVKSNSEVAKEVERKIKDNSELLNELAIILSKNEGRNIHTKYYIENIETGYFS
ncbi:MAG: hypothetical protein LUM44_07815 [Pyrinomonadaceae bacterium]|nr:hypothetical protein [Pyrinomonadaceae bacterium]